MSLYDQTGVKSGSLKFPPDMTMTEAKSDLESIYERLDNLLDAITVRRHRVENLCHRIYGPQLEMAEPNQPVPSGIIELPLDAIQGRIDEAFRQLGRFDVQLTALERL